MTKADMITLIAAYCGISSRARAGEALDAILHEIAGELVLGRRVILPHVGILVATGPIGARKGRNPRTGAAIEIKACRRIRFRPTKLLKARLGATIPTAAE